MRRTAPDIPRPPASTRMAALAESFPELASFTADATLLEIKTRYGLDTLEDVRELGTLRQAARAQKRAGA